ncbi:toll/interleukin-1 receptor domain-containing protein [Tsukamurella paurometabola]|uniref:Toll/interleukin-1 receptor domain-containing protein n=1 Tax=Tsukamurella paurometabola TaxID=2061 RepID=A0ABS5NHE2_TSUPA|nr:toll/interleukin-1 receptor domain-containing protein [Tsukamurella paurometabola]MBS4103715.1 toll/interleukin-1 receptor domain-containing protein [Tsukamurella paurometabola]
MTGDSTGFWSYAHSDNASGGHVRAIAEDLVHEYRVLTGDELTLFVDRDKNSGLQWGEAWRERISTTIAGTTFLIPIVSPSYLRSQSCRDEFLDFWAKAKVSSLGELLLPILYSSVDLSPDSDDEICRIVSDIQYEDWREVRLEERHSSAYKKAIHKLASRLVDIAKDVDSRPELIPIDNLKSGDSVGVDDSPGLIDLMVDAEDAMRGLAGDIARMNTAKASAMAAIAGVSPVAPGATARARAQAVKAIGAVIAEPLAELSDAGKAVESALRSVDLGVTGVVDYATEFGISESEIGKLEEMRAGFNVLARKMSVDQGLPKLLVQLRQMASLSRDLRQPMKSLEAALMAMKSSHGIVSRWESEVQRAIDSYRPNS